MKTDLELARETWDSLEKTHCYNCEHYYAGAVCGHTLEDPDISTDELRKKRRESGCGIELLESEDKLNKIYGK